MDFITELPKSQVKDSIYEVAYRLIKYPHFSAITFTILASEVASLFFKDIFRLHGFPKIIISERDSKFNSIFLKELFGMV